MASTKTYPLIEIFYSLKGEGLYTGTPMLFLRFAGCNLRCEFCDTPSRKTIELCKEDIVVELKNLSEACATVVLTGGEPNIHDLHDLAIYLQDNGYRLHMESNGEPSKYLESNMRQMDFIAISPKTLQVSPTALSLCDEIKYLVGSDNWEDFLWTIDNQLINDPKRWVMPLAEPYNEGIGRNALIPKNIQLAIDFCKAYPDFSLCSQLHKYLMIP